MPSRGSWAPSACFFSIAVAYTIGWTAVSSELTHFSMLYGQEILLLLNFAYFVPSVPTMILQTLFDQKFDRAFGVGTSTAFRLVTGLGAAALICGTFPFHAQKPHVLLLAVALLGICCGIAFGSSYQLVSRFSSRESVALTTGFVGSGPIVLLVDAVLRMGAHPSFGQRLVLYETVTIVIVAGMVAALYLLSRSWRDLHMGNGRLGEQGHSPRAHESASEATHGTRRHSVRQHGFGTSLLADQSQHRQLQSVLVHNDHTDPASDDGDVQARLLDGADTSPHHDSDTKRMLRIWPAAVSLFLSAFTSVLLFPFFTYVPMNKIFGIMQPSALFATRVIMDIIGRLVPKAKHCQTEAGLLLWSFLRVAATPLFFLYITGKLPEWANAQAAVLYVAVFWFTSGYINTCAFILAPQLVPPALASKAGGVMALVFQLASLVALMVAAVIQFMMRHSPAVPSDSTE